VVAAWQARRNLIFAFLSRQLLASAVGDFCFVGSFAGKEAMNEPIRNITSSNQCQDSPEPNGIDFRRAYEAIIHGYIDRQLQPGSGKNPGIARKRKC
jgi:hypothetical protein